MFDPAERILVLVDYWTAKLSHSGGHAIDLRNITTYREQ